MCIKFQIWGVNIFFQSTSLPGSKISNISSVSGYFDTTNINYQQKVQYHYFYEGQEQLACEDLLIEFGRMHSPVSTSRSRQCHFLHADDEQQEQTEKYLEGLGVSSRGEVSTKIDPMTKFDKAEEYYYQNCNIIKALERKLWIGFQGWNSTKSGTVSRMTCQLYSRGDVHWHLYLEANK